MRHTGRPIQRQGSMSRAGRNEKGARLGKKSLAVQQLSKKQLSNTRLLRHTQLSYEEIVLKV
jgi:hypothetical protein